MDSKIFIPKLCKVGFNKRSDTYTGKLGYVIYHDGKVWRKQTSWENWRQKQIEVEEFENTPIEGFVLNKDVGGVKRYNSWDQRTEKVRIYDPRGFEFEITIPNLLYILQNTSSIKGKGVEGNMIYGWSGSDLVLIPENAPEYQEMLQFTELQDKKISKKDLVLGGIYISRNNERVTYLGEYMHYAYDKTATTKKLWIAEKSRYVGTTPVNIDYFKVYTGELDENYADLMVKLETNTNYKPTKIVTKSYELIKDLAEIGLRSYNEFYIKNSKNVFKKVYCSYIHSYDSNYKSVDGYALRKSYSGDRFTELYKTREDLIKDYPLYKQILNDK